MLTMNSSPPNTRNWLTWSTSLVTRETRAPRRSVFWVSSGRSCTWRNALIRSVASPRSDVVKRRMVIRYDAKLVTRIASAGDEPHRHGEPDVGAAVGVEAVVEGLLDGDRHDDLADRRQHGQQQRDPDAVGELGRVRHAAADGVDRADVLAGVRPGWCSRRVTCLDGLRGPVS